MTKFDKFVEDVMTDGCDTNPFDAKVDDIGKISLEIPELPGDEEGDETIEVEELTPGEQLDNVLALFDITEEEKEEIVEKLKDKAIEMADHEATEDELDAETIEVEAEKE